MPYKDKEKDRERLRRYYQENKELVKNRAKCFYEKNRDSILAKRFENSEFYKGKCKNWRTKNKEKVKAYKRKYESDNIEQTKKQKSVRNKRDIFKLKTHYIITRIQQSIGISRETIKQNPTLIENQRKQIELKRLIKNKKHEQNH